MLGFISIMFGGEGTGEWEKLGQDIDGEAAYDRSVDVQYH